MTGRWHECRCGCGYWHKVINGRVICPHPNFTDLLGPGDLFVMDPARMCRPCVFELEQVLEASSRLARRTLAAHRRAVVTSLSAAADGFARAVEAEHAAIDAMLSEGGPVWEHES